MFVKCQRLAELQVDHLSTFAALLGSLPWQWPRLVLYGVVLYITLEELEIPWSGSQNA